MQLNLGTKIRELRRRDGRTQEALADALGVTAQAVSRWESGGSYPDMNLIPPIANYFGVTIDELFGYSCQREQKVDQFASRIREMLRQNNGVDVSISECISLARESLIEFPGNTKLMLCLASALYTAGYVRHGEHHLTDADGYSVYDTQQHRGYAEWREAVTLYEKALTTLENGPLRHKAVEELMQLYLNRGEHDKALALAESAPGIWGTRDFLRVKAFDGRRHAQAYGAALLTTIRACATAMIHCVLSNGQNMTPAEKARSIRGAISLFDCICPDGNHGGHHAFIANMHMLLSVYLWLDGRRDEAFEALEQSLAHMRRFADIHSQPNPVYTAPLVRLVSINVPQEYRADPSLLDRIASRLPEDWPWWSVPEQEQIRQEMQDDPRWAAWIARTQG